jgi:hypothetical protein
VQQLSLASTVALSKDQVSCELGDEAALLNLAKGVYYGLNEAGKFAWTLIQQGPKTGEQILEAMLAEYEVERDRCERDVMDLLNKLLTEGLIEIKA